VAVTRVFTLCANLFVMIFPPNKSYRSRQHPRRPLSIRRLAYAAVSGGLCGAGLFAAFASFGFSGLPFLDWLAPNTLAAYLFIATLTALLIGGMCALLGMEPAAPAAPAGAAADAGTAHAQPPRRTRHAHARHTQRAQRKSRFTFAFDTKHIAFWALVIFICWLPVLIMKYPCTLNGDTINQLYQFQTTAPTYYTTMREFVPGEFVDHHPVLDTLLYGSFLALGDALGSQNAGMFLLVILQSAVLAAVLSAACCYGARLNAPHPLQIASLMFFALWPLFPNYSAAVLKDTAFLAPWVLFFLCWLEIGRTRGTVLGSPKFVTLLILAAVLCTLTKKLGLYVVAPSLLILLIVVLIRRQGRSRLLGASAAFITPVLICALIIPTFVYPALGGVSPGGKQESLGFAFQQTIAVMRDNPSSVTQQEYDAVNAVLDVEAAKQAFSGRITDSVKAKYRTSATDQQLKDFLGAWVSLGCKNPGLYLATTATTTYHFFVPSAYLAYYDTPGQGVTKDYYWAYDSQRDFTKMFESFHNGYHLSLHRPARLIELNRQYDAVYDAVKSVPVVSLLFTQGLYGGWLPLLCFAAALYNRKRAAGAFVPIAFTALFMFLSPVDATRYVLPLVAVAPLLLYWTCYSFALRSPGPHNAADSPDMRAAVGSPGTPSASSAPAEPAVPGTPGASRAQASAKGASSPGKAFAMGLSGM
jgi:hypothetical protein